MSMRPKDIQDSINIALDAADAATDVTAEYSKIKRENKALEANVKQIHRSTTIIFYSAMITTVVATIFAGLVYFRTMSDLTEAVSKGLAKELGGQSKNMVSQLNQIEANTMEAITAMSSNMDDGRQLNAIYTRQGELLEKISQMMAQNQAIMQQITANKNNITYP